MIRYISTSDQLQKALVALGYTRQDLKDELNANGIHCCRQSVYNWLTDRVQKVPIKVGLHLFIKHGLHQDKLVV